MKVNVGSKVFLSDEKEAYVVQARDNRYIICTHPCINDEGENDVMYFIIDLKRQVRGTDDLVFGFFDGYMTKESCELALKSLQNGNMEVSYRNVVKLDIDIE